MFIITNIAVGPVGTHHGHHVDSTWGHFTNRLVGDMLTYLFIYIQGYSSLIMMLISFLHCLKWTYLLNMHIDVFQHIVGFSSD